MKILICYLLLMSNIIKPMYQSREIEEVFTPVDVDTEERNIILDINDPEVQKMLHKVMSQSIREEFAKKEKEKQEQQKKCCNSSNKVKAALIMAAATITGSIITIVLNNK